MQSDGSDSRVWVSETTEYDGPVDAETCEYAGHEWAPMGGGMLVCLRCETEMWEN